MASMFAECESLTSLDLSGWNTVSLQDASTMFDACSSLETIFVGDGWNMSNVTASDGMFNDCSNLKGAISYNAANANDVTYANTETGYLTYKAAPTTNP
jgi:surface protein